MKKIADRERLPSLATDTSDNHEATNIDVMIAALADPACTAGDAKMYSRAVARHLESALAGLAAVASSFVAALTVRP
jgi:hypothetical protein